jgi:hypothetical protein
MSNVPFASVWKFWTAPVPVFLNVPDACIGAPEESFTCNRISPFGIVWAKIGGVRESNA